MSINLNNRSTTYNAQINTEKTPLAASTERTSDEVSTVLHDLPIWTINIRKTPVQIVVRQNPTDSIDHLFSVGVNGYTTDQTRRFGKAKNHEKRKIESPISVLAPECVKIIDNKVYIWDDTNLWHAYSIQENPEEPNNKTIHFCKEWVQRYIDTEKFNEHRIPGNQWAYLFNYKNLNISKNAIDWLKNDKIFTRILVSNRFKYARNERRTYEGDIGLGDLSDYDTNAFKCNDLHIIARKKDWTIEEYSPCFLDAWAVDSIWYRKDLSQNK